MYNISCVPIVNWKMNKSGDNSERETPVSIPNTEVKPFSANGTWTETSWESRTLPGTYKTLLRRSK